MMKPLAVVLAFEDDLHGYRQNVISDAIRKNWSELIKLSPSERKQRIDEILKPERK